MSLLSGCLYLLACVAAVSTQIAPQIIGGTDSPIVPYQVSIRSADNHHICGGSIVSATYVLTAAHCVVPPQLPGFIVAGTNSLSSGGYSYAIVSMVPHPSYNSTTYRNDIAVINIDPPFMWSETIAPIALGTAPSSGTTVNVAGWGWTNYPGQVTPDTLQTVPLKIITNSVCQSKLGSGTPIYSENVCTKVSSGKGICHGDSGSPVVYQDKQRAVVQRVVPPCGTGYPDIHVRVSTYTAWIEDNIS